MHDDFQLAGHTGDNYPEWGSSPRRPLVQFDMAHKGEWMDSVIAIDPETEKQGIFHVVRCENCILSHVWPLPSTEALASFYAEKFYQAEKIGYLERSLEDEHWWKICTFQPLLQQCSRHIRLDCPEEDRVRFLDIGSGPGLALDTAQTLGWLTTGIEPNASLCQRSQEQGHEMYHGTVETLDLGAKRYDVIGLYEVLEHSRTPEDLILRCYDLLDTGGVLYVAVPSEYTPAQFEACKRYNLPRWFLSIPDHLNYFSPATLKLLVRRCGFQLRYIRMTFPMIEHFILGQDRCYVGHQEMGRQCHKERMAWELEQVRRGDWHDVEQLYIANVEKRVGREIIAVFVKQ